MFFRLFPLLTLSLIVLTGCSSGGAGNSTNTPDSSGFTLDGEALVYSGNEQAAILTTDNISNITDNIFRGAGLTEYVPEGTVGSLESLSPFLQLKAVIKSLSWIEEDTTSNSTIYSASDSLSYVTQVKGEDTRTCAVSGQVDTAYLLNLTGYYLYQEYGGQIKVTYTSCDNGTGSVIDGSFRIDVYTANVNDYGIRLRNVKFTFNSVTIDVGGTKITCSGTDQVVFVHSPENGTGLAIYNTVMLDQVSGKMFKTVDLKEQYTLNDIYLTSSNGKLSYSGRVYDSEYGYIDISTPQAIESNESGVPKGAGDMVFQGGNQPVDIRFVIAGAAVIVLENEQGVAYTTKTVTWGDFGTLDSGQPPVAVPVQNPNHISPPPESLDIYKKVPQLLNGDLSSDPDQRYITYHWEVISAPAGANVVITEPNGVMTDFTADLGGSYVLRLTVSNGTQEASTDFNVYVRNQSPVASFDVASGYDQFTYKLETIILGEMAPLDGSSSYDANDDAITYAWSVESPAGSIAAFSDSTAATTGFVPDIPGRYTIKLTVTDVEGASATFTAGLDVVPVFDLACTGTTAYQVTGAPHPIDVTGIDDIIPLCDGWVYRANNNTGNVDLYNVITGKVYDSYFVSGVLKKIILDKTNEFIFVLSDSNVLQKIDISTGAVSSITMSSNSMDMALGSNGIVFVLSDGVDAVNRIVNVVDSLSETILVSHEYTQEVFDIIRFDTNNNILLASGIAGNNNLYSFTFDPLTDNLQLSQTNILPSASTDMAINSDISDVVDVFPLLDVNDKYRVYILKTTDLTQNTGYMLLDDVPLRVDISHNSSFGKFIAVATSTGVYASLAGPVADYQLYRYFEITSFADSCPNMSPKLLRFGSSNVFLYVLLTCGTGVKTTQLFTFSTFH